MTMPDTRSMTTDQRLDAELVAFLDELAGELSGAPSVEEVQSRLAARVTGRARPLHMRPRRRLVLAMVLAALTLALMATLLVIGLSRPSEDRIGNGPIIMGGKAFDPVTGDPLSRCEHCRIDARWSADGQRVAYRQPSTSSIWVADLADDTERLVAHCGDCGHGEDDRLSMAADGGSVAFIDEGDVWLVDVETSTRTRITELGEGRYALSPTLAPEGDRVAFSIEGEPGIWVSELAGSEPWLLTTDDGPTDPDLGYGPHDPAWSPDGRTVAFLRDQFKPLAGSGLQLWLVDVVTREERMIANWPDCCVSGQGGPAWSPDGRELAVVATNAAASGRPRLLSFQLWVVAADGSNKRPVNAVALGQPEWRPVPLSEAATPPTDASAEDSPMPA